MTTTLSLNAEINNVLNSNASKKAKREALVKIGIRPNEALMVMSLWDKEHAPMTATSMNGLSKMTFGVEIETFVNWRNVSASGVRFQHQSYNHIDSKTIYKFVSDGSVVGMDNAIECVSPILKNSASGFNSLRKAVGALNEQNAQVNKTCGLHVHIGAEDLTQEQIVRVFKSYAMIEGLIDTFMAESRRENNAYYCRSVRGIDLSDAHDISDVECAYRRDRNATHQRYHKINPCAYGRHKTIEFRQHQGTTNYDKISNWVKFCAMFVNYAKDNEITREITSVDELPFLTKPLKTFFKKRQAEFAERMAA